MTKAKSAKPKTPAQSYNHQTRPATLRPDIGVQSQMEPATHRCDRFLLSRELLAPSGSVFVPIREENLQIIISTEIETAFST